MHKKINVLLSIALIISIAEIFLLLSENHAKAVSTIDNIRTMEHGIYIFYNIHNYLPGDFPRATKVWNTNNFNENCLYHYSDHKYTLMMQKGINGDGDGLVRNNINRSEHTDEFWEPSGAMCHLRMAGLLPYRPMVLSSANYYDHNSENWSHKNPKYHDIGIILTTAPDSLKPLLPSQSEQNYLKITSQFSNSALTPTQAQKIDKKIDNGMPGKGKIRCYSHSQKKEEQCCTDHYMGMCTESSRYLTHNNKYSVAFFYDSKIANIK